MPPRIPELMNEGDRFAFTRPRLACKPLLKGVCQAAADRVLMPNPLSEAVSGKTMEGRGESAFASLIVGRD